MTVVELGSFFAAPFGATLLAEQGARVIKVEPPEGDAIRNLMPFPDLAGIKVLHGKESVVLDLDDDADPRSSNRWSATPTWSSRATERASPSACASAPTTCTR